MIKRRRKYKFHIIASLAISLLFSVNSFAGGLQDYMTSISGKCPNVKNLIIKKSLIEMTNGKDCNESFTALLLKECPQISCSAVMDSLVSFNTSNMGVVIGK